MTAEIRANIADRYLLIRAYYGKKYIKKGMVFNGLIMCYKSIFETLVLCEK